MQTPLNINQRLRSLAALALCAAAVVGCEAAPEDPSGDAELRHAPQADEATAPQLVGEVALSASTEHSVTLELTTDEPAVVRATYDIERWAKTTATSEFTDQHTLLLDRLMAGEAAAVALTLEDEFGNTTPLPELVVDALAAETSPLPTPWASVDIGAVSEELPGSAGFREADGAWFVRGTGTDVYWDADSFHFVYAPVEGDFELTLRVDGYYGYLHQWTKAMTMFRATVDFDAAMFNQSLNYEGRDYLYYRDTQGALHTDVTDSQLHESTGAPLWGRLLRRGNTFTVYTSLDGTRWTVHGPAEGTTVDLPTAGFAGFGVCGKSNEYLSEIVYSNVTLAVCGDGIVAGSERCDDANTEDGDECPADCRGDATCGDGIVDVGEGCDDANAIDGDGCSGCVPDPLCGDGVLDLEEQCDDGNGFDNDGCTDCTLDASCGDGDLDEGEECDDGNTELGDGCENCQFAHFCGDGELDQDEQCDDGNDDDDDGCVDCRVQPFCGDGVVDDGEECDDANDNDDDGCAACRITSFCGDGVVDDGEECDDGNGDDGDGCSAACQEEVAAPDRDRDGVADAIDNCPDIGNTEQRDLDRDGDGDACDLDRDGDGLDNPLEDRDGDNTVGADETDPDNADTDGDGLCDGFASLPITTEGGDPVCRSGEDIDANGAQDPGETNPLLADTDGDCVSDGEERFGDDPSDPLDGSDPADGCGTGPVEPEPDAGTDAQPDAGPPGDAGDSPFGEPVPQEGLIGCSSASAGAPWSAGLYGLWLLTSFAFARMRFRQ